MKSPQMSLLLAGAFIFTSTVFAQDNKASSPTASASPAQSPPPPALTIPTAIDREITIVEKEVVDAAEATPEDKYNFSPESLKVAGSDYKGVRTFGEQLKHIAASSYLIWSPITGDKAPDNVND